MAAEAEIVEPNQPIPGNKRRACADCPAFSEPCLWQGGGDNPAHLFIVGKNPSWRSIGSNSPFQGTSGKLIKKLIASLKLGDPSFAQLKTYYSYAALVGAYNVQAAHLKHCAPNLIRNLMRVRGVVLPAPVIVTFGPEATKAIGLNYGKLEDVVGRSFTISINTVHGPQPHTVYPLFSMDKLMAQSGLVTVVMAVLRKAALASLGGESDKDADIDELAKEYRFPKTAQEVKELVDHVIGYAGPGSRSGPSHWLIGLDTETSSLSPYLTDSKVLMLSVAWDDKQSATILLQHPEQGYAWEDIRSDIERLLTCPKPKLFHHYKFDFQWLDLLLGMKTTNVAWCSLSGEHFLDEAKQGMYGLKKLTPLYIPAYTGYEEELERALRAQAAAVEEELANEDTVDSATSLPVGLDASVVPATESDTKKKRKSKTKKRSKKDAKFVEVPLAGLVKYAAVDSDAARQITKLQLARAHHTNTLDDAKSLMADIYLPSSRSLARMEYRGIGVDTEYLAYLRAETTKIAVDAERKLQREFSPTTKYTAPAQVATLMGKLNFEAIDGVTPGSTAELNLVRFYRHYGDTDPRGVFVRELLRYRTATNALSKTVSKIEKAIRPDGRIHCSFNLVGTVTGRLSSSKPNLQNIPKYICDITLKSPAGDNVVIEKGFNFKKLFTPRPGYRFFNMDVQGAELRVYTAYSKDPVMIREILNGTDIHSFTVSKCFDMDYADVVARKKQTDVEKLRTAAKRVIFGVFYGAGARKVAEQIEQSLEFAERLVQSLYTTYPGLLPYVQKTHQQVRDERQVRSFFGRYRRFKLSALSSREFSTACRQAVNFLIQSTSSDLVMSQLVEIDEHADEIGLIPELTVHDSIGGEIREDAVGELKPFFDRYVTERVREKFPWLPVPFLYDVEVGPNYGELEAV